MYTVKYNKYNKILTVCFSLKIEKKSYSTNSTLPLILKSQRIKQYHLRHTKGLPLMMYHKMEWGGHQEVLSLS
jgi:hypothetical protein